MKLNFNDNISDVCKKAGGKLNTLARVAPFIGLSKKRILMNVLFISLVTASYIGMRNSGTNNRIINKLLERCSRFIYNDKQSNFLELLEMDGSVSIHTMNIQFLVIEMFRDSGNLSWPIMNNVFTQKDNRSCNLRQISKFSRPLVKSVYHGNESTSFIWPKIWDLLER